MPYFATPVEILSQKAMQMRSPHIRLKVGLLHCSQMYVF